MIKIVKIFSKKQGRYQVFVNYGDHIVFYKPYIGVKVCLDGEQISDFLIETKRA